MVDPNRKINRLTDKDIEFLDECEEEFSNRFTDEDEEFMKYCSQAVPDPPIVQNWTENKSFNRNSHNHRGNYRSNYRWEGRQRQGSQPLGGNRGRDNRGYKNRY